MLNLKSCTPPSSDTLTSFLSTFVKQPRNGNDHFDEDAEDALDAELDDLDLDLDDGVPEERKRLKYMRILVSRVGTSRPTSHLAFLSTRLPALRPYSACDD